MRVDDLQGDLLSMAGHKFGAPKGVGALWVRTGTEMESLVHGAGHERGRRAGTESLLLTCALGETAAHAADLSSTHALRELRDRLWSGLRGHLGDAIALNGHAQHLLPNTLNVSFVGRVGAEVLASLDGVGASTGSACHAERVELSPVLAAMGVSERVGMGAVRFSLRRSTSRDEIDAVVEQFAVWTRRENS